MRDLDCVPTQQRLLEITVLPPKGRKLFFVRAIKREEDQAYPLRSDEVTGRRTKLHAKKVLIFFSPSLVGLAIESQCRRSFRLLFLQRFD